jgi:hypothetical protein
MSAQKIMEKLKTLLARKFERGLDSDGENDLIALLKQSGEARAYYFDYCELYTMLETDRDVRHELMGDRWPDNVVNLSGEHLPVGGVGANAIAGGSTSGKVERVVGMSRGWTLAAAAAVAMSLLALAGLDSIDPRGNTEGFAGAREKQEPGDREEGAALAVKQPAAVEKTGVAKLTPVHAEVAANQDADIDPMAKYEAVALTAVQTGSLKRPPTQFSNAGASAGKVSFNRDIRPLLSDKCYNCHGPDEESREAELRLDLEEAVFADRGSDEPVLIHRGDPAKSDLYRRLIALDPDDLMPPKDSHKTMTAQEIATVKKWIEEGAKWESHWAFIPPMAGDLPEVKGDWGVNEIDTFVLATLEGEGLEPSPEADRRTLIRRVAFDTTGLPPTPGEVEEFVNDRSGDAYGKLVDRLLDSPRYGEHRARYWLDAARYGDTHGLHLDNYRSIWPYRDWVVGAYNRNLPFDQFTIEQLAGDLLPSPTQEQLVATGFNRCNVTTSEGGSIPEEYISRYAIDRVSTMGSTWLGMTLGCAQCHDHKFDPVSAKEFYQLIAFFNNTTQPGMDGNSIESPPSIRVYPSLEMKKKAEALQAEIAAASKKLDEIRKADKVAFEAWVKDADKVVKAGQQLRLEGALLESPLSWEAKDGGKALEDIASFKKSQPFSIHLHFKAPAEPGRAVVLSRVDPKNGMRGYRLVWEDQGLTLELIEQWPARTLRRGTSRRFSEGSAADVVVTYDGSGVSEGIQFYYNGTSPGSRFLRNWADTMEGDFDSRAALQIGGKAGEGLVASAGQDLQLYNRRLTAEEVSLLYTQRRLDGIAKKEKRSDDEAKSLAELYGLASNGEYRKAFFDKAGLETRRLQIVSRAPETLVWKEKDEAPVAWVLERGEYDKQGEKVGPGVPAILHPLAEGEPRNRLGLAKWLVDPKNPLTARVMVNRFWGEVFGRGLVTTVGDFGAQGTTPSHPELLDWLAIGFMESGWDVKATYRKILMSATYRQSSRVTPELREKDPANRWLARGPRFRLDAEMIRDQALASGGVLSDKMGGPGVKPYQPSGLWRAVGYTGSNTQTFSQDYGQALYRRSIYTLIKRTAPPPSMSLFNAPNRESCVVARERTNTPLQALALMNDVQYIDAARHLAVRTVGQGKTVEERMAYLSGVLLARPLSGDDLAVMKDSYHAFEKSYQQDQAAAKALNASAAGSVGGEVTPVELASWIMLANQMLNLDEVINKN